MKRAGVLILFSMLALLALPGAAVRLRAQALVITEFLAENRDGILDEDDDSSDWIETMTQGGNRMAAYFVVQFTIEDPQKFQTYAVESRETIRQFGGRLIARGQAGEVHGDAPHPWGAVLEFADRETADRRLPSRWAGCEVPTGPSTSDDGKTGDWRLATGDRRPATR